jgi:aromatic ring-opening dioxygenase catalytic subunit (LigB family)
VRNLPSSKPKAILVVSAHWEERVPTVMSSPNAPMFYDYSGFPPEAYEIEHITMGRALSPLRDEGVFIVGSGDTFHNMRGFSGPGYESSVKFNEWLDEAITGRIEDRDAKLENWTSAPFARLSHPREEHLLPLMVVAGAAGSDAGTITWTGLFLGTQQTGYHFG